jgi:hypothetical protein
MAATIREISPWDGSVALMIDGGQGEVERPALHLQAAAGGHLRLVGPHGPILWGLVDRGSYGVDIVRARPPTLHVLPPIRAADVEPEWTRHVATQLCASSSTPLGRGRHHLLATTPDLDLRPKHLDALVAQDDDFFFDWDGGYLGLLLTRRLSAPDDGRVKMWRKRAREGALPPLVTWWCRGLFAHILLDGHDRVHAALLEGKQPEVVVLADVTARARTDIDDGKQAALDLAGTLDTIPSEASRAFAMNTILRAEWDPRAEWRLATPGFPLEGGVERWEDEVRRTRA